MVVKVPMAGLFFLYFFLFLEVLKIGVGSVEAGFPTNIQECYFQNWRQAYAYISVSTTRWTSYFHWTSLPAGLHLGTICNIKNSNLEPSNQVEWLQNNSEHYGIK